MGGGELVEVWGIERWGKMKGCLLNGFFDVVLLLLPGVKSFLFRLFSFFFFFAPEGLTLVNLSDSYIYLHISRSSGIIMVIII